MAPRGRVVACFVGCLLAVLAGCTQDRPLSEQPGVTPPLLRGKPVVVDTCDLLPPRQTSAIIARQVAVVGVRVEPPRLETVRCDLGRRLGQPLLSVELTTDPIAYTVFDAAYGQAAGGDPQLVKGLKLPSLWRVEGSQRTIRTFVNGAVVSIATQHELATPLDRSAMVALTRLAVSRLPDNPVLRERGAVHRCKAVSDDALQLALSRPATLEAEFSSGGFLQCSWGGQPGAVVVTVSPSAGDVRRASLLARDLEHVEVDSFAFGAGVRAWSATEVAGDLVVRTRDRAFTVEVTPAAGFSDQEIATTPPELALAREVIRAFE